MAALRTDASLPSSGSRRFTVGGAFAVLGVVLVVLGLARQRRLVPWRRRGRRGLSVPRSCSSGSRCSARSSRCPWRGCSAGSRRDCRGMSGRLARENATRNPRRTASTAAALMIGIAIVAVVAIFGASVKATLRDVLESDLKAEFSLQSEGGFCADLSRGGAGSARRRGPARRGRHGVALRSVRARRVDRAGARRQHEPEPHARHRPRPGRDRPMEGGRAASSSSRTRTTTCPQRPGERVSSRCASPTCRAARRRPCRSRACSTRRAPTGNDYLLAMRDYQAHLRERRLR